MSDIVAVVHSVARDRVQPHGRGQRRFNPLVKALLDLHSDVFVLIILTEGLVEFLTLDVIRVLV